METARFSGSFVGCLAAVALAMAGCGGSAKSTTPKKDAAAAAEMGGAASGGRGGGAGGGGAGGGGAGGAADAAAMTRPDAVPPDGPRPATPDTAPATPDGPRPALDTARDVITAAPDAGPATDTAVPAPDVAPAADAVDVAVVLPDMAASADVADDAPALASDAADAPAAAADGADAPAADDGGADAATDVAAADAADDLAAPNLDVSADGADGAADDAPGADGAADATAAVDVSAADSACPTGSACLTGGNTAGLCSLEVCMACQDVLDDAKCATAYGVGNACIGGACKPGCNSTNQCTGGKICTANNCVACTMDNECGAGNLCIQGACTPGNCRLTSDCTGQNAGLICAASAPYQCGACATDAQCQADPQYGASSMCDQGKCVAQQTCLAGQEGMTGVCTTGRVCCGSKCIPGNCCGGGSCTAGGVTNGTCRANKCTSCDAVGDGNYKVDPVNGDDGIATGSGMASAAANPICLFRTVTKALQAIGPNPAANTKITVIGVAAATTNLTAGEVYPLTLPANVTLTTMTGAIRVAPPTGAIAIRVTGGGGGVDPDAAAPLTIDGASMSGAGVEFMLASDSSKLANTTVLKTGDHGVRVNGGTIALGTGVTIAEAGRTSARRSGLYVLYGTVNVTGSMGAPTVFRENTLHGIEVSGIGSVNVTGTPVVTANVPSGQGTVLSLGNAAANLMIAQLPGAGANPLNTIDGLVSWGSQGNGIRIHGGSRAKVRNTVSLNNLANGVYVYRADATGLGNDITNIDLGTNNGADAGKNYLQARQGSNQNAGSGVCIELAAGNGAKTLNVAGNYFAGPDSGTPILDCQVAATSLGAVSASCGNHTNLGNRTLGVSTPITFNVVMCTVP
jgi:hypothetical protein